MLPHLFRVAFMVIKDVSFNPGSIGLFCTVSVILATQSIADTIEEVFLAHRTPSKQGKYGLCYTSIINESSGNSQEVDDNTLGIIKHRGT